MDTFHYSSSTHLRFGNATNARRTLIIHVLKDRLDENAGGRVVDARLRLNTSKTAKLLVTGFLPFCNQTAHVRVIKIRPEDTI